MSGVSTGSNLLSVETRKKFEFTSPPTPITKYVFVGNNSASSFTDYVIELGGETIISQNIVFTPTTNTPTAVFTNPISNPTNRITFSLSSSTTLGYNGTYKLVMTTASGKVLESPQTRIKMAVNYVPMTTSYPIDPYTVSGSPIPITTTSPDSFGVAVNSDGLFGFQPNTSSNEFVTNCTAGNLRIFLRASFFGNVSANLSFVIPDSSNFLGNYGGFISTNLTRLAAWNTASDSVLANFSAGSGQYLRMTVNGLGKILWSTLGSTSTANLVNGWWATEDGGDCKVSPTQDTSTELIYNIKYTHVSGSNSWRVISGGGFDSPQNTILSAFSGRALQLDANTIGTTNSVVKVSFYTSTNVLLYEQNVTLTVNKTA